MCLKYITFYTGRKCEIKSETAKSAKYVKFSQTKKDDIQKCLKSRPLGSYTFEDNYGYISLSKEAKFELNAGINKIGNESKLAELLLKRAYYDEVDAELLNELLFRLINSACITGDTNLALMSSIRTKAGLTPDGMAVKPGSIVWVTKTLQSEWPNILAGFVIKRKASGMLKYLNKNHRKKTLQLLHAYIFGDKNLVFVEDDEKKNYIKVSYNKEDVVPYQWNMALGLGQCCRYKESMDLLTIMHGWDDFAIIKDSKIYVNVKKVSCVDAFFGLIKHLSQPINRDKEWKQIECKKTDRALSEEEIKLFGSKKPLR